MSRLFGLIAVPLLLAAGSARADMASVDRALTSVESAYGADLAVRKFGLELRVVGNVGVANVQLTGGNAVLSINDKLAESDLGVGPWQTIFCHEIGHVVAGAPFVWVNPDNGGVMSAEGQADYFAAAKCLKRLWSDDAENRAAVSKLDAKLVKSIRAQGCVSDQCVRIVATGMETLTRIGSSGFSIEKRSPVIAKETHCSTDSLPAQCRLDTMLAGAMCAADPNTGFSEFNQRDGACVSGVGARPRCWFAPDSLDGIY